MDACMCQIFCIYDTYCCFLTTCIFFKYQFFIYKKINIKDSKQSNRTECYWWITDFFFVFFSLKQNRNGCQYLLLFFLFFFFYNNLDIFSIIFCINPRIDSFLLVCFSLRQIHSCILQIFIWLIKIAAIKCTNERFLFQNSISTYSTTVYWVTPKVKYRKLHVNSLNTHTSINK